MIGLWSAILLVQQAAAPARDSAAVEAARRDSLEAVAARRDSAHRARRRAQRDVLITPELSASAYHDAVARELIARARRARLEQDSTLVAYDATSRQRLTVWLSFRASGPERLLLRSENAARVRWQRGRGAVIDVIGARTAFPMFFTGSRVLSDFLEMDAIPYFPGREGLLQLGGAQTVTKSDESWFIHPLERGAEAYYAFRAGDSVIFRLPDGTRIHLQEVAVEARKPSADLIVGALWFDAASGQLVRGVFRPSVPIDIVKRVEEDDSTAFADVPTLVKPMIFPMELTITGFTVEYGLHEQRWWMPRSETVEGRVRAGFTHAAVAMEQSFTYANVNGRDTIPRLFASREDSLRHVPGDSLYKAARRAARDSAKMARDSAASLDRRGSRRRRERANDDEGLASFHCSGADTTISRGMRYDGALPIQVRVPCDTLALLHSPELPPSIYASGEQEFGLHERDELVKELTMSLQPDWDPQPVQWHYGIDNSFVRFNRVDALDAGVGVSRVLGRGYSGELSARISTGGPEFYGEAHLARTDGNRTDDVGVYRRLAYANDWGDPLTFRASLNAFVLGTDLGFYYNAWGGELRSVTPTEAGLSWRLFAEQQSNAPVTTNFSIPHALNGHDFTFNVQTPITNAFGASVRLRDDAGLDPHGWRASYDARAEGATGTYDYGRVAFDGTLSHGLGRYLDGMLGAGAGTSVGDLPPQRQWFLGGAWTIRGQPPGTSVGNAYWMGHGEIGWSFVAVRPTLFFDIGWAGARENWRHPAVPVSGGGVGISFLDGLIRTDVARAIQPSGGWTLDISTGARF